MAAVTRMGLRHPRPLGVPGLGPGDGLEAGHAPGLHGPGVEHRGEADLGPGPHQLHTLSRPTATGDGADTDSAMGNEIDPEEGLNLDEVVDPFHFLV